MSILIAEDNEAQRRYLKELLAAKFSANLPLLEAKDGEEAVDIAIAERPQLAILDIQMPKLSGVKAARSIWREFPDARIIFWTQFPHEIYINEIRKIVRSIEPQPTYGFIHKNNPEDRFLRFIAAVLEDGADIIDPAFKDSFQRPLLTEFEAEALRYLALGLANWAIARKCSKKIIYHNGRWHGSNATFIRLPDDTATIIAIGNKFTRSVYHARILASIFGNYFGPS